MIYRLIFILLLAGCSGGPAVVQKKTFIDVKGYFQSEIKRLGNYKTEVKKTVSRNNQTETQMLNNINWQTELSLFVESDINKSAWRNSYKISKIGKEVIYSATDSALKTRQIRVLEGVNGRIKKVQIKNNTNNMLYQSSEILTYVPDSLYKVVKNQKVFIIGENRYVISGSF
ncbi:MAG: hypothetical protein H7096_12800 [Flavobacterium sp.]|nr:hypothetical protein [Pedobacter sp.]